MYRLIWADQLLRSPSVTRIGFRSHDCRATCLVRSEWGLQTYYCNCTFALCKRYKPFEASDVGGTAMIANSNAIASIRFPFSNRWGTGFDHPRWGSTDLSEVDALETVGDSTPTRNSRTSTGSRRGRPGHL